MSGIVLATDLSEESRTAFEPTAELARKLGLTVTLVSVVVDIGSAIEAAVLGGSVPYLDPEKLEIEYASRLQALAAEFPEDVQVETEVLHSSSAALAVVDYAAETQARFIAMSTHGRTGLSRLVMGSVAEAVLRHTTTPVICFPMHRS